MEDMRVYIYKSQEEKLPFGKADLRAFVPPKNLSVRL